MWLQRIKYNFQMRADDMNCRLIFQHSSAFFDGAIKGSQKSGPQLRVLGFKWHMNVSICTT